jgi:hypothetical protein
MNNEMLEARIAHLAQLAVKQLLGEPASRRQVSELSEILAHTRHPVPIPERIDATVAWALGVVMVPMS